MSDTWRPRQPKETEIPGSRLRLRPRGQRPGMAPAHSSGGQNSAGEVIDAIVALAEARANWEERHTRLSRLLDEHDEVVELVGGERLPRPYAGPWLLPEHVAVVEALAAETLDSRIRAALAGETRTFASYWHGKLAAERQQRHIAGDRLAQAS